jgi:hypothetical protein
MLWGSGPMVCVILTSSSECVGRGPVIRPSGDLTVLITDHRSRSPSLADDATVMVGPDLLYLLPVSGSLWS